MVFTYLYALATVSITFVGFSALLIVVRQGIGGELTAYDSYFTLTFIHAGFIVTACSLTPPLLTLCDLPAAWVWRASSIVGSLLIFTFVAALPARRRRATSAPMPIFVRALLGVQLCAATSMLLSAIGVIIAPGIAPFALALTTILFTSGIGYLLALHVILPALITSSDPPADA